MAQLDNRYTEACPYCKTECEADWVDVEIGYVQCGPFYCENCKASSIGAYDTPRELTEEERRTGWYGPYMPLNEIVNQVFGIPIDHKTALILYQRGFNVNGIRHSDNA